MTNYAVFKSFSYNVAMFIAYIVCFVVKLAFDFICSWFVLYTLQAVISQSHINFTVSFMTYFYLLNMPVDINTWCAIIGLFVNTTQQSEVFHLTKCRDFTLYRCYYFFCY